MQQLPPLSLPRLNIGIDGVGNCGIHSYLERGQRSVNDYESSAVEVPRDGAHGLLGIARFSLMRTPVNSAK